MNTLKSTCFYHTDQLITNFCKDKNCLMPLCPSCIGEHSSYHEQNGSKPQYHNIYETLSDTQTTLYNSIYSLEVDKKRITDLSHKINSVNDLVNQRLAYAKNFVYSIIEEAFKDLQSELKSSLSQLHEQIGLFSSKKTQKLQEGLNMVLHELYEINEGMKGQKFLGHIIIFLKQKEKQSVAFHSKLSNYLDANQNYTPKLDISNEATASLSNCITRILKVQGKKDFDRRKQAVYEPRNSVLLTKRPQKDYQDKTDKIERSYTPQRSINTKMSTQTSKIKLSAAGNSPYTPQTYAPGYSPLREKTEYQRLYQPVPSQHLLSQPVTGIQTSRIRDFKQEYEMLSRKVSQMRKENQMTSKTYK